MREQPLVEHAGAQLRRERHAEARAHTRHGARHALELRPALQQRRALALHTRTYRAYTSIQVFYSLHVNQFRLTISKKRTCKN